MRAVLPRTEPARFGVFTLSEALAVGWTTSRIRTAIARGRLVRLHRGSYVDAEAWRCAEAESEPEAARRRLMMQLIAAMLAVKTAVASHTAAAVSAGLPVWTLPARPCVTVLPRFTGDAATAHLHRAGFVAGQIVTTAAVPRLRSSRTIVDIAREHGIENALVVGDSALNRGMVTSDQLLADLEFCAGWPGIRRAERVLPMLDGRAESPLESVSRLRLHEAGLPTPELQPDILDLNGHFLGRPDLYWDDFGVIGEVDGLSKYRTDPLRSFADQVRRQGDLEQAGLLVVRWGRADLENMPALRRRLEAMFARGARTPRSERGWIVEPRPPIRAYTTFAPLNASAVSRNLT